MRSFRTCTYSLSNIRLFKIRCVACKTSDKIEKNELGGACSADGRGEGVYRVLVGKPEGKRPLG
jgi:hypothetical protein